MGNSGLSLLRTLLALPLVAVVVTLTVLPTRTSEALFHISVIDEVMTSYDGDATVQFVEINMLASSQTIVANSVLAAFDTSGNYTGDVFIMDDVLANSGSDVRWIIGTSQFQTVSGLAPDFIMPPGLPTGGGMICWGAPGAIPPFDTGWDRTNFLNYVDCVAYGTYSGPSNVHIGTRTPIIPDGHSLQRSQDTANNLADFDCGDPADPENNEGSSVSLAATISCTPPVGGVAELPDVAGAGLEAEGSSGPSATVVVGVVAAVTAGAVALGSAGWYARRRRG